MVASSPSNMSASPFVLSKDGTKIGYLSVGGGPSVLVIPGVLSMAADYAAFARALAERFMGRPVMRGAAVIQATVGQAIGRPTR
jgi:hypothetical protein